MKGLKQFVLMCMSFGVLSIASAVYYDEATNTYVYEETIPIQEVETTSSPVSDTAPTTTSSNMTSIDTHEEEEIEGTELTTLGTSSTEKEEIDYSGTLEYMHLELADHLDQITDELTDKYT